MSNPFEKDDHHYFVLVNDEGQHSLWPTYLDIPSGWEKHFEGLRQDCLTFVEDNWTDMRPLSLVKALAE